MTLDQILRAVVALPLLGLMSACGTSYTLPKVDEAASTRASAMFAQAKAAPPRKGASASAGMARFARVAARIQPVAERFCTTELASKGVDCKVGLGVDPRMADRNAYFTYDGPGHARPTIRFSLPMLQDVDSDDELAFILSHEYGHLIGQHILKQQQQAVAGALILGAVAAYGNAQAASAGQRYDPDTVSRSVEIGAALGQVAYSQTYELESDMLGTRIAAAAGYDPVKGARYFARDEAERSASGGLSFWGTHPSDARRIAVVLATVDQMRALEAGD